MDETSQADMKGNFGSQSTSFRSTARFMMAFLPALRQFRYLNAEVRAVVTNGLGAFLVVLKCRLTAIWGCNDP